MELARETLAVAKIFNYLFSLMKKAKRTLAGVAINRTGKQNFVRVFLENFKVVVYLRSVT